MKWETLMVEQLIRIRQAGETDFAMAWRRATAVLRYEGVKRPRDYYRKAWDDHEDPGWMPYSTFFRHACEREWYGLATADWAGLPAMLEDGGLSVSSAPDRRVDVNSRVSLVA